MESFDQKKKGIDSFVKKSMMLRALAQRKRPEITAAELDAMLKKNKPTSPRYLENEDDIEDMCSYIIDDEEIDHKTFVWPGGTHEWEDQSSGTIWVGVHGLDSICVVTRTGDLDMTRVHHDYKSLTTETVLRKFRKTIISEIEDLASPSSSKLHQRFGESIPKPFGVVSVIPHTHGDNKDSGHEVSSTEYDEAINFLREKMKTMTVEAFTVDETIKAAISAFQHLFHKEFVANEFEVTVVDPKYLNTVEEYKNNSKDMYVRELEMSEVEYHLDAIHKTCLRMVGVAMEAF